MSNKLKLPFEATIEVRDACICLDLQRAARVIARKFDDALRPVGLTNGQFSLLISLNRPEPPTMGSVAELLALDRTTLTANLKPLERRGLLTISPDANDKRSRRLALTDTGHALLKDAYPLWCETEGEIEKLAGPAIDPLRTGLKNLS
jgi:DNA-binding MarR family transcriptional regulator